MKSKEVNSPGRQLQHRENHLVHLYVSGVALNFPPPQSWLYLSDSNMLSLLLTIGPFLQNSLVLVT